MEFKDIKSAQDLCEYLNISNKKLRFLCYGKCEYKYTSFEIDKKNGKSKRAIKAPIKQLCFVQEKIKNELEKYYHCPNEVNGFVKGKSIVDNARRHIGKMIIINLDIKDFFTSINYGRIYGLLKSKLFGFNKEVAHLLTCLLTCRGVLPQGSPASPIVSNLIFYSIDKKLKRYCEGKNITYSRYADDITFSFGKDEYLSYFFYDVTSKELNEDFERIFMNGGFSINKEKTRIQRHYMHQEVTGIKVNKKLNLSKNLKYQIRGLLNAIETYNIEDVAKEYCKRISIQYNKTWENKILNKLSGLISYWGMVKGKHAHEYICFARKFNKIVNSRFFELTTTDRTVILDNCVLLIYDGSRGVSGTAFTYDGYIVTCHHCIEGMDPVGGIYFFKNLMFGTQIKAKLKYSDEQKDVAIFKYCNNTEIINLKKGDLIPRIGNKVSIFGYPDYKVGVDIEPSQIEANITNNRIYESKKLYVIDKPVQLGLSGSPVLDKNYALIGMVVYGSEHFENSVVNNGFISLLTIDECIKKIDN